MKKILFILSLLLLNVFVVTGQNEKAPTFSELKQLVRLVSTCDDVKKILKIDDCSSSWVDKKYKDFSVSVTLSDAEPCQPNKFNGKRWNVPQGTVLQLSISSQKEMFLSEYEEKFKENLKEYKKTEVKNLPGSYYYDNEEKGISISTLNVAPPTATPKENIIGVFIYPQKSKGLECENISDKSEEVLTFLELKQLVPLVSTCDDVKKILKIDDCSSLRIDKKYKDFSVSITLSDAEPCQSNRFYGKRWNVPQGTVLQLSISLRRKMFLSEYEEKFKENLKEYKKTEVNKLHGLYYYDNEEKGIYISTTKEVASESTVRISLYPPRSRESGCENVAIQSEEVPTFSELKQLVPLVSTCDDVKKILKIDDCSSLWIRKKYKDFSVSVTVSIAEPCQANKFLGGRWNVPQGTVLDLYISLRMAMPLSEYEEKLKENLKEYKKTEVNDLPGFYYYDNEEKGITISTTNAIPPEEFITGISLYPPKSKESECEKKTNIKTPKDF